jgi:hypothetical protein
MKIPTLLLPLEPKVITPLKSIAKTEANVDGCYIVPVGGLNVKGASNKWYKLKKSFHLFDKNEQFMRNVFIGKVFSEMDGPSLDKKEDFSKQAERLVLMEPNNVCGMIKDVSLVDIQGSVIENEDYECPVSIMASIKPIGPHAKILENAIQHETSINYGFALRGIMLVDSISNGDNLSIDICSVITFDLVRC